MKRVTSLTWRNSTTIIVLLDSYLVTLDWRNLSVLANLTPGLTLTMIISLLVFCFLALYMYIPSVMLNEIN